MKLHPDLTPTDEELVAGFERCRKAFEPQAGDLKLLRSVQHPDQRCSADRNQYVSEGHRA
jgi:hypothetical protein